MQETELIQYSVFKSSRVDFGKIKEIYLLFYKSWGGRVAEVPQHPSSAANAQLSDSDIMMPIEMQY